MLGVLNVIISDIVESDQASRTRTEVLDILMKHNFVFYEISYAALRIYVSCGDPIMIKKANDIAQQNVKVEQTNKSDELFDDEHLQAINTEKELFRTGDTMESINSTLDNSCNQLEETFTAVTDADTRSGLKVGLSTVTPEKADTQNLKCSETMNLTLGKDKRSIGKGDQFEKSLESIAENGFSLNHTIHIDDTEFTRPNKTGMQSAEAAEIVYLNGDNVDELEIQNGDAVITRCRTNANYLDIHSKSDRIETFTGQNKNYICEGNHKTFNTSPSSCPYGEKMKLTRNNKDADCFCSAKRSNHDDSLTDKNIDIEHIALCVQTCTLNKADEHIAKIEQANNMMTDSENPLNAAGTSNGEETAQTAILTGNRTERIVNQTDGTIFKILYTRRDQNAHLTKHEVEQKCIPTGNKAIGHAFATPDINDNETETDVSTSENLPVPGNHNSNTSAPAASQKTLLTKTATLGCFVYSIRPTLEDLVTDTLALSQKTLCVVISKHLAIESVDGKLYHEDKHLASIITPHADHDISVAKIDTECVKYCETSFKSEKGHSKNCVLYQFKEENGDAKTCSLSGEKVHIWGAKSRPGMVESHDFEFVEKAYGKCIFITDISEKPFSKPGDSGAVVCSTEARGQNMFAAGFLVGEITLKEEKHTGDNKTCYIALCFEDALKEIADRHQVTYLLPS